MPGIVWYCPICTLQNPLGQHWCSACGQSQPHDDELDLGYGLDWEHKQRNEAQNRKHHKKSIEDSQCETIVHVVTDDELREMYPGITIYEPPEMERKSKWKRYDSWITKKMRAQRALSQFEDDQNESENEQLVAFNALDHDIAMKKSNLKNLKKRISALKRGDKQYHKQQMAKMKESNSLEIKIADTRHELEALRLDNGLKSQRIDQKQSIKLQQIQHEIDLKEQRLKHLAADCRLRERHLKSIHSDIERNTKRSNSVKTKMTKTKFETVQKSGITETSKMSNVHSLETVQKQNEQRESEMLSPTKPSLQMNVLCPSPPPPPINCHDDVGRRIAEMMNNEMERRKQNDPRNVDRLENVHILSDEDGNKMSEEPDYEWTECDSDYLVISEMEQKAIIETIGSDHSVASDVDKLENEYGDKEDYGVTARRLIPPPPPLDALPGFNGPQPSTPPVHVMAQCTRNEMKSPEIERGTVLKPKETTKPDVRTSEMESDQQLGQRSTMKMLRDIMLQRRVYVKTETEVSSVSAWTVTE